MSFDHERAALVAAVGHLSETRVMPYSGHANVSLRLDGERMLLTTPGVVRNLTADQLAVVKFDGATRIGMIRPAWLLDQLNDQPQLAEIAREVEQATVRMIDEAR